MRADKLGEHRLVGRLGANPVDKEFTLDRFKRLLAGKKGNIKTFMLDQKNIAGIGNVYIQDMLFLAKIHPQRKISSLTDKEIEALYKSMRVVLDESIRLGGLKYEKDFYGKNGRYGPEQFRIAYKPGKPCPACRTTIQKTFAGSLKVAGMTPPEVAAMLRKKLVEGYLKDTNVSVFVDSYTSKKISVFGQVSKPGTFNYMNNMSIIEAFTLAGGFTPIASKNSITITRSEGGKSRRFVVPVDEIGEGRAVNYLLRPGDIVFVPERLF